MSSSDSKDELSTNESINLATDSESASGVKVVPEESVASRWAPAGVTVVFMAIFLFLSANFTPIWVNVEWFGGILPQFAVHDVALKQTNLTHEHHRSSSTLLSTTVQSLPTNCSNSTVQPPSNCNCTLTAPTLNITELPSPPPSQSPLPPFHVVSIATRSMLFHAYAQVNALLAYCERCHVYLILVSPPPSYSVLFRPNPRLFVFSLNMPQRIVNMGPKGAGGDGTFVKLYIPHVTGLKEKYWYIDTDAFPTPDIQQLFERYENDSRCLFQKEGSDGKFMVHGAIFKCHLGFEVLDYYDRNKNEVDNYLHSIGWGLSDQPILTYLVLQRLEGKQISEFPHEFLWTSLGVYNCLSSKDPAPVYLIHTSNDKEKTAGYFAACVDQINVIYALADRK